METLKYLLSLNTQNTSILPDRLLEHTRIYIYIQAYTSICDEDSFFRKSASVWITIYFNCIATMCEIHEQAYCKYFCTEWVARHKWVFRLHSEEERRGLVRVVSGGGALLILLFPYGQHRKRVETALKDVLASTSESPVYPPPPDKKVVFKRKIFQLVRMYIYECPYTSLQMKRMGRLQHARIYLTYQDLF